MIRTILRCGIVLAALAAPLLGACIDNHEAENCQLLLDCPLPDAGDAGDTGNADH